MKSEYKIKKGKILSREGIPGGGSRWLSDGRLSFSWDEKGVQRLEYVPPRADDCCIVLFRRGVFNSFRCFLEKDGATYQPAFRNIEVTPYSLTADWERDGDVFRFGVYALEECAAFSVAAPAALKNSGWKFKLYFYKSTQYIPAFNGDGDSRDFDEIRVWRPWERTERSLIGGYEERFKESGELAGALYTVLSATAPMDVSETELNARMTCRIGDIKPGGVYAFALAFGTDRDKTEEKCDGLCGDFIGALKKQDMRYQRISDAAPRLNSGDARLDGFFSFAPLYHESLKSLDAVHGGALSVKSKTSRYWIWGWDSMLANFAPAVWGDAALLGGMLDFFQKFSHPEYGTLRACKYNSEPATFDPPAAQGLYISMLLNYYAATGDGAKLRKHYGFVREIFNRMTALEAKNTGLLTGISLFPDFPDKLKENGNDLSLFNNTLFYGAARAMEALAVYAGDPETAAAARGLFTRAETSFKTLFFDGSRGYFVNSLDADTLEKRDCVNICGVMWDEDYMFELLAPFAGRCTDFIKKHGVGEACFRAIPLWDDCYDGDANQLHCTWTATEEAVLQFARLAGKTDIIDTWTGQTGYWVDRLTVPEGVSYFIETDTPEYDAWNCEPGVFQAYTLRKWYQEIIKVRLGITLDTGGATFAAPACVGYVLRNFTVNGRKRTIKTKGAGGNVEYIDAGGKHYFGTLKLPADAPDGSITVKLSDNPQSILITSFIGGLLTEYSYSEGTITTAASGAGTCRLYVENAARVLADGKEIECKDGRYELFFEAGKTSRLTVIGKR